MSPTPPVSLRHESRCAAPDCTRTLERGGRGRPRIYCSAACRSAAHRKTHPTPGPLTVEVDHGSTSAKDRPAGRVWLVRLRRGNNTVILASGLGWPSANHLADQITQLIHPAPLAEGAPTE